MFKGYRASREFSATAEPLVSCQTQRKLMVEPLEQKGVLLPSSFICSRKRYTINNKLKLTLSSILILFK